MKTPRSDYDSLWKEAIYKYSRPFLEFFFLAIAQDIDWSLPVVEQDTELRALLPNSGRGRRTVDALLEVTKLSGETGFVRGPASRAPSRR